MLYETWYDDFEEERKKKEKISAKKRKREQSRSKSRSPTPVSKGDFKLDLLEQSNTKHRRGSVKQKSNNNNTSSCPVTDSEEENKRELLKIKAEILKILEQRDEPLTVLQISYNTKYAKKYCEEALVELQNEKKIMSKEIAKNNIVFYLVYDH